MGYNRRVFYFLATIKTPFIPLLFYYSRNKAILFYETKLTEYKTQKRGGSGIKTVKVTPKTGKLMVARVVTDEIEEILAISRASQVIRTELKSIPTLGRDTQGVRVMKLRDGDSIASLSTL